MQKINMENDLSAKEAMMTMNVNAEEQPQLDLIVVDATTISTDINEKKAETLFVY